ncbi:MAG: LacI family DNA-binding transcriptional regulator [Candidatus Caldatribacteriota bacterium]|nr:LacI family DNA-binding transcriptional regulator [Candidatus Caldatribacteriota bacterium]
MKKKSTIYDVAKIAGVSPSTISRVMNTPEIVAEDTRQKVVSAVKELSYIPNMMAASMPKKRTNYIGLIIPDIINTFFSNLIRGIQDICEEHGYNVLVVNSDDSQKKEGRYLKLLYSRRVDGVILTVAGYREKEFPKEELSLLKKMNIVLVDREINGLTTPIVKVNNFAGAYSAVKYLLTMGHKKIMYLAGIEGTRTNQERRKGYLAALKKENINWKKEMAANFRLDTAYQKILCQWPILQNSDDLPTAIFAANDLMAIGALKAFSQLKVRIPKKVSIIGFDNIPFSDCTYPPLTTIAQPTYLMGQKAVKILLKMINKKKIARPIEFKTKLIERGSVSRWEI